MGEGLGGLGKKDSKRKSALGRLWGQKRLKEGKVVGRNVVVGRTSEGKWYFQIALDEAEMEKERKEVEMAEREGKSQSGEKEVGQVERKEGCKSEQEKIAKATLEQVRDTEKYDQGIAEQYPNLVLGGSEKTPKRQDSKVETGDGKRGDGIKLRNRFKTSRKKAKVDECSPAKSLKLLPKPDMGLDSLGLASHGSAILSGFGDVAVAKHRLGPLDGVAQSDPPKTQSRAVPAAIRNKSMPDEHQAVLPKNQIFGPNSLPVGLWLGPDVPKTPQHSTQNSFNHSPPKPTDLRSKQLPAHDCIPQQLPNVAIPKTPQHSAQNSVETKKSPSSNSRLSKAPSVLSTSGSTVDDGQSLYGPVEIMNAKSAEFIRAQGAAELYSAGPQTLPRPGPAPTSPLPSLPEVNDGAAAMMRRSCEGRQSRIGVASAVERYPVKALHNSPNGRYRLSPCKRPAQKAVASPQDYDKVLQSGKTLQDSALGAQMEKADVHAICNNALKEDMSAMTLEQKHTQRIQLTKALKERDLQRSQAQQRNVDTAEPGSYYLQKKIKHEGIVSPPSTTSLGDSSSLPPMNGLNISRYGRSYSTSILPKYHRRMVSEISPIIVVAEQEPAIIALSHGHFSDYGQDSSGRKAENEKLGCIDVKQATAGKIAPRSLGDGFQENLCCSKEGSSTNFQGKSTTRPRHSDDANTPPEEHRLSINDVNDLEAKFEARIAAIERKNMLLHRALADVLNDSSELGTSSGGDRSSELSSASSQNRSQESRLEAKFDAVITLLQDNKRLSAEV